jgi:hypothetical protein
MFKIQKSHSKTLVLHEEGCPSPNGKIFINIDASVPDSASDSIVISIAVSEIISVDVRLVR